jgi:hypothetical protein
LYRKFLAVVAAFLLAAGPSPAKVIPLGTVTHAERAHIGQAAASVGTTIYDGDRLSTDIGGALRINGAAITLQVAARSSVTLRRAPTPEANVQAELGSGTITFSSGQAGNIAVLADDASIRPASHVSTMAQIWVISQKELLVYALRGSLNFSYHGDSKMIPEGTKFRVLLDPSEREVDAASESNGDRRKPFKLPKFVLIAIGITAGLAVPIVIRALESPDRP